MSWCPLLFASPRIDAGQVGLESPRPVTGSKPARTIAHIGVDEKTAGKSQNCITVVCDLERGTAEHIADERQQTGLYSFLEQLTLEQREARLIALGGPRCLHGAGYSGSCPR